MRITLYVPKIVLIQFMSFCIPMYENERKILLFFSYNSSLFNEIFLFFHGPMEKAKKKKILSSGFHLNAYCSLFGVAASC